MCNSIVFNSHIAYNEQQASAMHKYAIIVIELSPKSTALSVASSSSNNNNKYDTRNSRKAPKREHSYLNLMSLMDARTFIIASEWYTFESFKTWRKTERRRKQQQRKIATNLAKVQWLSVATQWCWKIEIINISQIQIMSIVCISVNVINSHHYLLYDLLWIPQHFCVWLEQLRWSCCCWYCCNVLDSFDLEHRCSFVRFCIQSVHSLYVVWMCPSSVIWNAQLELRVAFIFVVWCAFSFHFIHMQFRLCECQHKSMPCERDGEHTHTHTHTFEVRQFE